MPLIQLLCLADNEESQTNCHSHRKALLSTLLDLLLIGGAPLPYFITGTAIWSLVDLKPSRVWVVPILGCAALGWFSEVGFVTGVGAQNAVLGVLLLASIVLFLRKKYCGLLKSVLAEFYLIYAFLLVAILVNPFPALGHMSGDWFSHFSMSQAILSKDFPASLLARPPLFAAIATPLYIIEKTLGAFQICSVVVSTAAVLVFHYASEALDRQRLSRFWIWMFVVTAHYLTHAVTLWPKMFVAGAIFLSAVDAYQYRKSRSLSALAWSGIWFGFSLGGHHSSILYAPLLAVIAFYRVESSIFTVAKRTVLVATLALMTAGIFEGWVLMTHGLNARIAQNPVVANLRTDDPYLSLKVFLSSFAGFLPWHTITWKTRLLASYDPSMAFWGKSFYLLSCWIAWLTCTFLGLFLPILIVAGRRSIRSLRGLSKNALFWPALLGVLILMAGASILQPHFLPFGATQCGLDGLNFLGFWTLATLLRRDHEISATDLKRILSITMLLGTFPFLVMQTSILFLLRWPHAFADHLKNTLMQFDVDAAIVFKNGVFSLGWELFPYGVALGVALIALVTTVLIRTRDYSEHPRSMEQDKTF